MQQSLSQQFSLPLLKKEKIAKDTWVFTFSREDINYQFLAGQYNTVSLPLKATDGNGASRSFTISSSPLDKDILEFTTKEGISDFKKALFDLEVGNHAIFQGPKGGFILRDEDNMEKVFLAGGIGITPFYSMIRNISQKNLNQKVYLFASFSTTEDVIFQKELREFTQKNPNIHVVFMVAHPEKSQHFWSGEKGRITEELLRKYITHINVPIYSIVGPAAMIGATEELLQRMGIQEGKIKLEQFDGY